MVVDEIYKISGKDPALAQWLSAALGYAITGQASGASININATKNNFLHMFLKDVIENIDPHSIKPNEALALYLNLPGKGKEGIVLACYVAQDKDNPDDLSIFDSAGVSVGLDFGSLSGSVTVVKVSYPLGIKAAEALQGISFGGSVDFAGLHGGINISIPQKEEILNSSAWRNGISLEQGADLSTVLGIHGSGAGTWYVGKRSEEKTWHPYTFNYKQAIEKYLREHPNETVDIHIDSQLGYPIVTRKVGGITEMLVNSGENTTWWQPLPHYKLSWES